MRSLILSSLALVQLPISTPAQTTRTDLDPAALQRLLRAADVAHSDAVVLWKDGRPVGTWRFGRPRRKLEVMSITKSIVSLAIGRLVTTGGISSVDVPISQFYPEWREGPKRGITLRHVLTHTSGLQDRPDAGVEVERSRDLVHLALVADLSDPPGTRFVYNNKAVNLLTGVVEQATGKRLDLYLRDDLFAALGIRDFDWQLDSVGHAEVYAGLRMYPEDLAKLGQLVLDRGRWKGRRLIDAAWIDDALRGTPLNPRCGLLWWLIPERTTFIIDDDWLRALEAGGVDTAFLRGVTAIRGRYESLDAYIAAQRSVFGPRWWDVVPAALAPARMNIARTEYGPMIGYEANGYLGQYLVVYPDRHIVAVRMIAPSSGSDVETTSFDAFRELVHALVKVH